MDDQVLSQIVAALDAILDPNTSPGDRTTAHSICESCKENELACLIGYTLASKQDAAQHVKHFGLQLMQHFIRNKWATAAQEAQIQTKNNTMELIKTCQSNETCYVKDGIAHVLAEVVKHVWPQQWPSMVRDLLKVAKTGFVQTELVELVFLRVAEDVAVLRNIISHRSQDIRHAFSLSMSELMEFFMRILDENSMKYATLLGTTNRDELQELMIYYTLSTTTLKTLQGFFEWIAVEQVFAKDGAYVHLLCKILEINGLKVMAAECLTLAIHQKGQAHERKFILTLMMPVYVEEMINAIKQAVSLPSDDEEQYSFLKRMGGLISTLSGQLVSAWGTEEEARVSDGTISDLSSYRIFLNVMFQFLCHENPVLSECVTAAWQQMLVHRGMSKDETLKSYVPDLLKTIGCEMEKNMNVTLPSYSQLDFNDDDEVQLFVSMHRRNLMQIVRGCTCALPSQCMQTVIEWLKLEIELPVDTGVDKKGIKQEHCSDKSPTYLRWDALKSVLEMTIKSGVYYSKKQATRSLLPIQAASELLNSLLLYETTDIMLYQILLSFIGALLPLLETFENQKQVVTEIIRKFSTLLRYSTTHPDKNTLLVRQFRKHCLSAIVHLCKYYSSYVILAYDDFKDSMLGIVGSLGNLEKINICESMVLVSGEWNNFATQSALIEEIMTLAEGKWLSEDDQRFSTPKGFASSIGLLSPASEYHSENFASFRDNISFCVALTMAMINRSRIPSDPDVFGTGGFVNEEGDIQHPCAKHVLVVMEYIANLVQNFHALWTPPIRSIVHSDYQKSLEIRQSERKGMISFNPVIKFPEERVQKHHWEKMQTFILVVLENCYQILGGVGKCCNLQLYANPNLFPVLLKKSLSDIQTLPELRIRSFTRQFLYYFLKSCPESCYQFVAAPLLSGYCEFMNEALQGRWNEYARKEEARLEVFKSHMNNMQTFEDGKEDDEILYEQLLRTVSREYLEMLVNLCVNKRPQPKNGSKEPDNDNGDDDEKMEESAAVGSVPNITQLTPLGVSLASSEISGILLNTALVSLSWHDTTTAFKGVQLTWPLLKHAFSNTALLPEDAGKFIFESVLYGLQRQGEHDGCCAQLIALSLFIYTTLRPSNEALLDTLKSIPRIDVAAVENFDSGYAKFSEKKRKSSFKKLVSRVIEEHIGQRYKIRQEMRRLPKFFQGRKPKSLEIDNTDKLGLEMLFKPESN